MLICCLTTSANLTQMTEQVFFGQGNRFGVMNSIIYIQVYIHNFICGIFCHSMVSESFIKINLDILLLLETSYK